ncbi:MAG: Small GTP-binding protein [Candidatus Woesebacteria bacterium GW2011_GWB1_43_14]|uniref:50S ribosomal subunit assembly factor BipA n=1 Tax=Candidatus Woesebacteria bacterium GW2011_GWB1_43_14 TaxID=1618578 RepID=A0A0G1GE36_9BACT|nr:MAG: Small GTP-binding protein [Candidatus Woesebacteria bacterium GW2011_GWA1_39_11b]KKS78456.1 MAG: Small GTP-binding protein [Candidatus Woesebacteria bacterium GW2011_GWC1_42_9]KKS97128.1 MAG: Small GTP-binding protein [Candidatus Woesebacteria bacterium GW2011_GWB1_43_14]
MNMSEQKDKRNIAVIAHVDHGKTTLVDALLKQTHTFRENEEEMGKEQIMDSGDLERERGITILAKNCAVDYKNTKINIIDTPGHADFSGEVERTLGMAEGALLIVDAQEGPMPQTRFVLRRALELGLKIIVVINKIDKRFARVPESVSKLESLFLELAKDESQLDFPIIYAIGRRGVAFNTLPEDMEQKGDITPLLDLIISHVPAPKNSPLGTFKMVVTTLDYEPHLGQIAIGKIFRGKLVKGEKVIVTNSPGKIYKVEKVMVPRGLGRVEVEGAEAGEIVAIAGVDNLKIGQTISDPSDTTPLPEIAVSPPTLHITLGPNTSPLAGQEGEYSTGRQIEERLRKEIETNLSLKVEALGNGKFKVSGRGELHLAILLETLRREGYEMEVGKPEVILKKIDGVLKEPVEEVNIIVPQEFVGVINQEMGKRYAKILKMEAISEEETEFIYQFPTRAMIGLRGLLLNLTKGTVVMSSQVIAYEKIGRELPKLRRGALISQSSGSALAYSLETAQNRGITFIDPGETVYEGMIIGQNAKNEDIEINVCKGKKLTNMRSKSSDGIIQLTPATKLSLEQSLDFLERDELLEITPKSLRLRKKHLTVLARRRINRAARSSQATQAMI